MQKYQDLSKFTMPAGFRGRGAFTVQIWWLVQAMLFHPSPQIFYGWRRFLLRLFGAEIGYGVIIRPSVNVTYPWKLKIGDHTQIGDQVELYNLANIVIGRNSVVSQGSYLCTGGHDPARLNFDIYKSPIEIEDEVWIAAQCFIMPGVTIRRGTFCKVRSLVTSDTEAGSVVAGSPARKTGERADITPLQISPEGLRNE